MTSAIIQLDGSQQFFFYGVNGDLLKTYSTTFQELKSHLYFADRRVQVFGPGTEVQFVDRLGSVRTNSTNSRYYPYGEEQQATANDTYKFATYFRDSTTTLDYAQNRYYASTQGRFTTADPSSGVRLSNPGSWNHYSYLMNDPINYVDSMGLDRKCPPNTVCVDVFDFSPFVALAGDSGSGGGGDSSTGKPGKSPQERAEEGRQKLFSSRLRASVNLALQA